MTRPVGIDLCCCSGAASMGYSRAGFNMMGVDIDPQPKYPFYCLRRDILEMGVQGLLDLVDAVNAAFVAASPPCQKHSKLRTYQPDTIDDRYDDLIEPVRTMVRATGLPYVIENVPEAPLLDPIELCGCMFPELRVYRRRHFESNIQLVAPPHGDHTPRCARNGYLPTVGNPYMTITGGKHSKAWQRAACEAMGTPWLAHQDGEDRELAIRKVCEAIPPAYTEFIGAQVMAHLELAVAA